MRILRKHPIYGLVSAIVFAGAVWNLFSSRPPAQVLWEAIRMTPVVFLAMMVSAFVMVTSLYFLWTRPVMYKNRVELEQLRGGLRDELDKQGEVFWAMFPAGSMIDTLHNNQLKKIDRLILGNPSASDGSIERSARESGAGTPERIREGIKQAARRARESKKVEVKFSEERGVSLLISNPESNDRSGWARLEFLMPYLPGPSRPSFVVTKRFHPELFSEIVRAYTNTWDKSVEPQ